MFTTGKKSVQVASQMTHAGGTFHFEGLAPGSYTVKEVLQSGWTQTAPAAPGSFSAIAILQPIRNTRRSSAPTPKAACGASIKKSSSAPRGKGRCSTCSPTSAAK